MMNKQDIMVTIRCLAYNHEPYIRKCLDGFVMQITNFRFEAIVHDDASTDGTATIIKEYADKYPDIIKPILEIENQYSKHDDSLDRILNAHTHGKYIAICEGDDYWTDPFKLQKQVDFLNTHSDFSMCFHKSVVLRETNNVNKSYEKLYNHLEEREYGGEEILRKWTIPTASVVYRSGVFIPYDKRFIYGDIIIFLSCIETGRIFCLNDAMSVYRRHEGGVSYKRMHFKKYMELYDAIIEHFGVKYERIVYELKILNYVKCFIGSRKDINYIKEIMKDVYCNRCIIPFSFYLIRSILSALIEKLCNIRII